MDMTAGIAIKNNNKKERAKKQWNSAINMVMASMYLETAVRKSSFHLRN